jgi:hypothetical protein
MDQAYSSIACVFWINYQLGNTNIIPNLNDHSIKSFGFGYATYNQGTWALKKLSGIIRLF